MRTRPVAVALLILLTLTACASEGPTEPDPALIDDFTPAVAVTGKLLPATWADLTTTGAGQIVEVLVETGDHVDAGQVLIRLDRRDAEAAVRQAEAAVLQAERELARLVAAPADEAVAVATAQIRAARAALTQTIAQRDALRPEQVDAQLAEAEAQIAAAQAEELVARQDHDETMRCREVTREDGSTYEVCPLLGTYEERARAALNAVRHRLAAAEAQRDAIEPSRRAELRIANAGISAADAQVDLSVAQLDRLLAGASATEIGVAEAAVAQAEAALDAAQVQLEHTVVRAPFSGTVGALYVRRGELATPGLPLLTLGDLSTLRVEITDLDEIDVGRVVVGRTAVITFDALPDRTFTGEVVRIAPMAATTGGGVTYTTILVLDELDAQLRWGMTAFVDITTDP